MAEEKNWTKYDGLFLELVNWLSKSCWVQLGKIKDPITGEFNKNLKEAEISLGMLEMLKEKTAGNLDDRLSELLTTAINELKANFVQVKQSEEPATQKTAE